MRFLADGMLGKLARWLRLAGYDVKYIGDLRIPPEDQDSALVGMAVSEGRTLLTRDFDLHRRAMKAGAADILVESDDIVSQLVEVSKRAGEKVEISPENSRCPSCNGRLESAGTGEVEGLVPEKVLSAQSEFWKCVECGKVYWHGRHWDNILEMARRYNVLME